MGILNIPNNPKEAKDIDDLIFGDNYHTHSTK